ncbi:MAG TPA: hypothetical protein VIP11_07355 [Gemmatimonadaceae bacterium]
MRSIIVSLGVVLVMASACASGGAGNPSAGGGPAERVNRDRNVITREELSAPGLRAQSVLDAVKSLRPQYFSQRGVQSFKCGASAADCQTDSDAGGVHASIDNGRILPIQELANMHVNSVLEVRFLPTAQAMQKFGTAALEGPVILVLTIK